MGDIDRGIDDGDENVVSAGQPMRLVETELGKHILRRVAGQRGGVRFPFGRHARVRLLFQPEHVVRLHRRKDAFVRESRDDGRNRATIRNAPAVQPRAEKLDIVGGEPDQTMPACHCVEHRLGQSGVRLDQDFVVDEARLAGGRQAAGATGRGGAAASLREAGWRPTWRSSLRGLRVRFDATGTSSSGTTTLPPGRPTTTPGSLPGRRDGRGRPIVGLAAAPRVHTGKARSAGRHGIELCRCGADAADPGRRAADIARTAGHVSPKALGAKALSSRRLACQRRSEQHGGKRYDRCDAACRTRAHQRPLRH